MTLVDETWIRKVCAVHKRFGIGCTYRNRGGKQYITLRYNSLTNTRKYVVKPSYGNDWHRIIHQHIRLLFKGAHVTSGGFGGGFDITIRLNP